MSRWYYELPYGPLTRKDFDKLSLSFYDDTDRELRGIAEQRGLRSGEAIKIRLGDMIAKSQLGVQEIQVEETEND